MRTAELVAYVTVIILLVANLYMSYQVRSELNQLQGTTNSKKSLPCESVPLSWAVANYDCANSLLNAMNVTNVRFDPPGRGSVTQYNRSVLTHRS